MGKIKQGILGGFSGKVGPVIGAGWKGKATMRAQAISRKDPKTDAQLLQRAKFTLVGKFIMSLMQIFKAGFKAAEDGTTSLNEAMSYNLKNAVIGTVIGDLAIDPENVRYSVGGLPGLEGVDAIDDASGHIKVTWLDNTGGEAHANDTVTFILMNKNKDEVKKSDGTTKRSTGTFTFSTPAEWSEDDIYVHVTMKSDISAQTSQSQYLGHVTAS